MATQKDPRRVDPPQTAASIKAARDAQLRDRAEVTAQTGIRFDDEGRPCAVRTARWRRSQAARLVLVFAVLACAACGSSPAGPTTIVAPAAHLEMDYDINIADLGQASALRLQYPHGVEIAPYAAQQRWDQTVAYGGSPNVYYGPIGPPLQTYQGAGIVVAPLKVAQMATFTADDWPGIGLEPGAVYVWIGRFVYTQPVPLGTCNPNWCRP